MRRSPGVAGDLDRRLARRARLVGAAVHRELVLEAAAKPGAADVVADRAAARLDRARQHRFDGFAEPVALACRKALALAPGVQFRAEAGLVGVDVADARDRLLVE